MDRILFVSSFRVKLLHTDVYVTLGSAVCISHFYTMARHSLSPLPTPPFDMDSTIFLAVHSAVIIMEDTSH
jgi:hypothetical protein